MRSFGVVFLLFPYLGEIMSDGASLPKAIW